MGIQGNGSKAQKYPMNAALRIGTCPHRVFIDAVQQKIGHANRKSQ